MKVLFTILFVLSVLLPTKLAAETYQSPEILVSASSSNTSSEKPSAFVTVLDPKDYENTMSTLPEVLAGQVGIFVKNSGGLTDLSTVSLRGSTAEQVSVYLDGLKLNSAQGGAVDFSSLPLESLERIEIIRGGASHRFGSDAVGGVINLISKKAKNKKAQIQAKVSVGSFWTLKTHEAFNKKWQKLGLSLSHSHLSSQGDYSFKESQTHVGNLTLGGNETFKREHNQFLSEDFLIHLHAKKENFSYQISQNFFLSFRQEPGTEIESTQLSPANPLEAERSVFRQILSSKFTWNLREDLSFYFQPQFRWEQNHFKDPSPALGPAIDVNFFNHRLGGQVGLVWEKQNPKHQHLVKSFLEIYWDYFKDHSPIAGTPEIGRQDRLNLALFIEDEISLLGERLQILPSLRWEYTNDFGSQVLPHLGLIATLRKELKIKSNVGLSFRYPNFNELYFPDQGFVRGNPDLNQEKNLHVDLGLEWQVKKLGGSLSYFYQEVFDSIVFVPVSAFTIAPLNTSRARIQGLEAEVRWKPVDCLSLAANYTFLDAKLKTSSQPLPGRPKHLAKAKVEFEKDFFKLFSQVHFTDQLPIGFSGTRRLEDKIIVDAGMTFKIKSHYFLSLEGKNLGNVQSYDSVGFPLPRLQFYASFAYKA
ncbi:MAG: TonB-dependent receptor [Deltaproteobacteria bacterium]|nr:TonB-dependent receptor [Deltaproteobacteria bacterium]